jgi:hypothetical protein
MIYKRGWGLTLLITLATLTFLWLVKTPILALYMSEKTGLEINARLIGIWPSVTNIRSLSIQNPPGFKSEEALSAKKTSIHYHLGSIQATPAEIDEILLKDIVLDIEIRNSNGSDNNWARIGAKLPKSRGGKEVIIHKLILQNMTVKIHGAGADQLGVSGTDHFDQMEFDEINSKDGFPTKELVSRIFEKAGLLKYVEQFFNPADTIKDTLNPFNVF